MTQAPTPPKPPRPPRDVDRWRPLAASFGLGRAYDRVCRRPGRTRALGTAASSQAGSGPHRGVSEEMPPGSMRVSLAWALPLVAFVIGVVVSVWSVTSQEFAGVPVGLVLMGMGPVGLVGYLHSDASEESGGVGTTTMRPTVVRGSGFECVAEGERSGGLWVDRSIPTPTREPLRPGHSMEDIANARVPERPFLESPFPMPRMTRIERCDPAHGGTPGSRKNRRFSVDLGRLTVDDDDPPVTR